MTKWMFLAVVCIYCVLCEGCDRGCHRSTSDAQYSDESLTEQQEALLRQLGDDTADFDVRERAAWELVTSKPCSRTLVKRLLELLKREFDRGAIANCSVMARIATALGYIGDPHALPMLRHLKMQELPSGLLGRVNSAIRMIEQEGASQ